MGGQETFFPYGDQREHARRRGLLNYFGVGSQRPWGWALREGIGHSGKQQASILLPLVLELGRIG